MMIDGQWQLEWGDSFTERATVNYGVVPFPSSEAYPGRANSSLVQGPVLIIPAAARDKGAAVQLLAWTMSPERLADAAYAHACLPASRAAAQDGRFRRIPNLDVFLDLISDPNVTNSSNMPDRPTFNGALAELEKTVLHQGGPTAPLVDEFQRSFARRSEETPGYEK